MSRTRRSKAEASYDRILSPCYNAIAFPKSDFKTVVVIGCGRGGTSAVAGSIHCMGVRMMERPELNSEDRDIVQAFQRRGFSQGCRDVSEKIKERNAEFKVWGWKDPSVDLYLESVFCFLRNPHFLFVLRNPMDVALSHVASKSGSVEVGMEQAITRYHRCWEIVKKLSCPTLLVGYERAISRRRDFVAQVVEFLDISPTKRQISKAVSFLNPKGGYKMPEDSH